MSDEDGPPTAEEEMIADVAAFLLVGRPERIEDAALAMRPGAVQVAAAALRRDIAAIAMGTAPCAPPAELRDRVMKSVARSFRRRALVVVDMIRDHLTEGCALEVPRAREILPALEARLTAARAAGMPIVYVVDEHDPDDPDLDLWGAHAIRGSEGAEVWPSIAPREGDRVVGKPSYSGFFASDLEAVLDELKVDSLVLTGCATEIQLKSTAMDALQKGYEVEIPPDSQAGNAPELEMATLVVLRALVPYAPARRERLERLAA
jgi:nicotinamidase-related amidase